MTETWGTTEGPFRRRRKGATRASCAECRRLKLKCDRSIPCGSCVKRGCSAICPDGSLTTGLGNRFVLASTQELHAKIHELANRVRDLEDALRYSHSQLPSSFEPHPLLTEELLKIKAPLQRELRNDASSAPKEEEPNPDIVDAFGSLSISMSGRTKYFGHIANSWNIFLNPGILQYFLQNELPEDDELDNQPPNLMNVLPPEVLARSATFPISPTIPPSLQLDVGMQRLLIYLPRAEKAAELREIFYRYAAWMHCPISLESFNEQIYSQFYEANYLSPHDPLISHRQALLFMVLAIGSLMDLSQPAYNLEAEKYHQLARATLFSDSIFEEPTIHAVQTVYLMAFYLFLADRHGTGSESRWAITGLAIKIAQSVRSDSVPLRVFSLIHSIVRLIQIGLHRDSVRFKVDQTETQRRRELFWELYTYDSWQCLTFGRPPSFSLAHIDCELPYSQDTSDEHSYHSWKHRFASECMSLAHDQAFGAKTPTYNTIIQLHHKIYEFPVPPILQVAGFGSSEPRPCGYPESTELLLQRHIVLAIREMNLFYLHRGYFSRAVSDGAKDPLEGPYGRSVLEAYRSARSFIALMRNLYAQLKETSERLWFLWAHAFSCAIVLGSIVTRCPSMRFAPSALGQLDAACEAFSKVASGFRAQKVLAIMLRLREKAHVSLNAFREGMSSSSARRTPAETSVDGGDELDTLGGKTRLVANKESSVSPQLANGSLVSVNGGSPESLSPDDNQFYPNVSHYFPNNEGHQFVPGSGSHALPTLPTSYATDTSVYGLTSIRLPHQDQTSYPHQLQLQPQQRYPTSSYLPPTNAVQIPNYDPVYDFALQNGYHSMQLDNEMLGPGVPEDMHAAWQNLCNI